MSEIHLKQLAQRFLVHRELDAEFILQTRYLITEVDDLSSLQLQQFLAYLNVNYSLNYNFSPETYRYWHVSPAFRVDPEDPRRVTVRVSALNGNGVYSGYRDFTYNRMDVGEYLSTLGELSITDAYVADDLRTTIQQLIGIDFDSTGVVLDSTVVDGVTEYTIEVTNENNLLWYGRGTVRVKDIPGIDTVIRVTGIILAD